MASGASKIQEAPATGLTMMRQPRGHATPRSVLQDKMAQRSFDETTDKLQRERAAQDANGSNIDQFPEGFLWERGCVLKRGNEKINTQ